MCMIVCICVLTILKGVGIVHVCLSLAAAILVEVLSIVSDHLNCALWFVPFPYWYFLFPVLCVY